MATLHEIASAKDGESFISVGPATVIRQNPPKLSKNGRPYSTLVLKNAASEMLAMLWDDAALWRIPSNAPITLKGKFSKTTFSGKSSVNCDEMTPPDGAVRFDPPTDGAAPKATMKECLDAGIRAADYMLKKERPELAEAAFSFAANAMMNGLKPE